MFTPYSQAAWPTMTVTVKSATDDPLAIAPAVRAALREIDAEQPVSRIRTMDAVIAESIGQRRFPMLLLGVFLVRRARRSHGRWHKLLPPPL